MLDGRSLAIVLAVGLMLASGLADARGLIHAANIWGPDGVDLHEVWLSGVWYALGIGTYWVGIIALQQWRPVSAELLLLVWFGATVVGVAVTSGRFLAWTLADQAIGVAVIAGIAWLTVRTSA